MRGKRRAGDDCIGSVAALAPRYHPQLTSHIATESSGRLFHSTKRLGKYFLGTYPTLIPTLPLYSVIDPLVSGYLLYSSSWVLDLMVSLEYAEWLTSEGIVSTSDTPVLPTPAQTPAIPPTPELSNASTPANTGSSVPTPSDRGKKRTRREVVSQRFVVEYQCTY